MNLLQFLQQQFHQALKDLIADPAPYVAMVKPAQDARHGDYQANCAMALAKELGRKPRDIAQEIRQRIPTGDWLMPPEIASSPTTTWATGGPSSACCFTATSISATKRP